MGHARRTEYRIHQKLMTSCNYYFHRYEMFCAQNRESECRDVTMSSARRLSDSCRTTVFPRCLSQFTSVSWTILMTRFFRLRAVTDNICEYFKREFRNILKWLSWHAYKWTWPQFIDIRRYQCFWFRKSIILYISFGYHYRFSSCFIRKNLIYLIGKK